MATSWFIKEDYLKSKLAQLKSVGQTQYADTAAVEVALLTAGFTPLSHFLAYGSAERTSPNKLFEATEYLEAKARQLGGSWTVDSVAKAISDAGLSVWQHFETFGWAEGVNPSNSFSVSAYLDSKLADLQAKEPSAGWTLDKLKDAFKAAGLSPIDHYEAFGKAEGIAVTPVPAAERVAPGRELDAGKTFTLTTGVDTIIGTAGNDVGTGTSATLQAGDTIIDQSTTDNDVLNLTLTAANNAARISNIENINVNWDAFGDASFVATNVTGASINLSSTKVGYLGNATVTDAGANKVVAGEGMKGALTVNGVTGATIDAVAAKTVTVNGSTANTDTVTVTAGAETTTVTVAATVENAKVTAGAKTTAVSTAAITSVVDAKSAPADAAITITGTAGTTDSATVQVGNNASVSTGATFIGAEKLTLDVADGKVVTLATQATSADTVDVTGAGAVTIKGTATNLTTDTITKSNAGALNVELTDAGVAAFDSTKIAADNFKLTATNNAALVVKSGQSLEVAANASTADISVKVAAAAATNTDTVNLKLTSAAYDILSSVQTATDNTDIETITIEAAAAQAAGAATATDLTIASVVATGNTVNLKGTNDVQLTLVDAKVIDASALNGRLIVSNSANTVADLTIAGAQGNNNVKFDTTALTSGSFIGQAGDDTVNFQAINAGTTVTAVTGDGKDTVIVDATALLTGAGAVSVETGAGDDTVELVSVGTTTGTIVLQFGDGNDTLKLGASSDVSAANLTLTGLEKLVINTDATFKGSQLSGTTLAVEGTRANAVDVLKVNATVATGETINLAGLTGTDSTTTGILGAEITGLAGKDVLVGTNRNDKIDGGAGADQMTGGLGADTFVIKVDSVTTAAAADVITDFKQSQSDKLDFGTAYNATTDKYAEGTAAVADYAAALAAANVIFNATTDTSFVAQQVGSDTYVFFGAAAGTAATEVVKLVGVALTDIDATAIA